MCESSPRATDVNDAMKNNLTGEAQFAPEVLSLNQQFSPAYTQLNLQNLSSFLTGNSGNATGGATDLLTSFVMPQVNSAINNANTATRTSTINDVMNLAPSAALATRAMNPGAASLLDTVTGTAANELGYGRGMTPGQRTALDQSVRGGQAARGMGFSPSDVFNESLDQAGYGDELLSRRMSTATGAAGASQAFYGDPFSKIAGTTSTGAGGAMGLFGMGSGASGSALAGTAQEFNPQSAMGAQFAQNKYQATSTVSQEKAQAVDSMMGELGGSSMSSI